MMKKSGLLSFFPSSHPLAYVAPQVRSLFSEPADNRAVSFATCCVTPADRQRSSEQQRVGDPVKALLVNDRR